METYIEDYYVYEVTEFGYNIFDSQTRDIGTNCLNFTLYNATDIDVPVELSETPSNLKISYPIEENYNFTEFHTEYSDLSAIRPSDILKRADLVEANQVNCTFYDPAI
jgi:hypothetical protein